MSNRILITTILVLVLSGCSASYRWAQPGSTAEKFQQTTATCDSEYQLSAYTGRKVWMSREWIHEHCLESKGWTKVWNYEEKEY